MPHKAISRPFSAVRKAESVPRDRYFGDRWTCILELVLSADPKHLVVIGAGWLDLHEEKEPSTRRRMKHGKKWVWREEPGRTTEHVVAEIVRGAPGGPPVIPGSSIKGAVRQVYELLTPSCEPGTRESCSVSARSSRLVVCPACSLFGGLGLGGRLGFGEAILPKGDAQKNLKLVAVPYPWAKQKGVPGTYRFYGQKKEPREEKEMTWAAFGEFRTRLRVVNASDDELGLLFASLGIGWKGPAPGLRLGGRKYHGFGAVQVKVVHSRELRGRGKSRGEGDAQEWAEALVEAALDRDPGRRRAWDDLHATLSEAS